MFSLCFSAINNRKRTAGRVLKPYGLTEASACDFLITLPTPTQ
jgi:hypothetical protein